MADLNRANISPLIILDYGNTLYQETPTAENDDGEFPTSSVAIQAFVNYALATLKQYPQIHAVEVWNEANVWNGAIGGVSPQAYLALLKAVYTAIKATNPNVTVVGGAVAGYDTSWIHSLFELGGLKYMDVLSIHPYRNPSPPEGLGTQMTALEQMIRSYNDGHAKPVWITEIGWPTQIGSTGVSPLTEAQYLVQSAVIALSAGVQRFSWYDFMNDGLNRSYDLDNFGIIHNAVAANGPYAPKPAYNAYATLMSTMKYVGPEQMVLDATPVPGGSTDQTQDIRGYRFMETPNAGRKEPKSLTVLWSTGSRVNVELTTPRPVTVTGIMGNARQLYPWYGHIYLTLTGSQIYVSGMIGPLTVGGPFALTGPQTAAAGSTMPIILSAATSHGPIRATFTMNGKSYTVAAVSVRGRGFGRTAVPIAIQSMISLEAVPNVVSVARLP
jgi:hypothetical protein